MSAPFRWVNVSDQHELEAFYRGILPKVREAARALGYAIGVHGSMRRDLDLIAMPWSEGYADKEQIARAIHRAACGLESSSYQWERKHRGRSATSFPVCFPKWNVPNNGHIDLSVAEFDES